MWIFRFIPSRPKASPSNAATPDQEELSIAAVTRQRAAAINSMVAALRHFRFVEARRHSYEEIRLNRLLETLNAGSSADRKATC